MNVLFTICGRAGSKGIKSKNVRDFCGIPLVYYSLVAMELYIKEFLADSEKFNVVLSTDSPELVRQVSDYTGLKTEVIDRDESLCGDVVGKKDVILDCLLQMENRHDCKYDVVVDLDITSPLRTKMDIDKLVKKHFETSADITYSVTTARRNPFFNQVMKTEHGFKTVCEGSYTARQQTPEVFDMNASIYAYNPDHLKNGGGFTGGYYEAIEMYDTAVLDLDKEDDFELMQVIAEYLFNNRSGFKEVYDKAKQA